MKNGSRSVPSPEIETQPDTVSHPEEQVSTFTALSDDTTHDDVAYHGVPPFVRLRAWLRAERDNLWVAVIYSGAIGILSLVVPIATQSLVNTIAFGTLLQPLVVLTLLVFAFLGFSAVLSALRTYVVEMMQRRVFVRVAADSVHRLLRAEPDAFHGHHPPELVNRFLEVVTVQKAGATLLIDGLTVVFQTLIGMILLAVYHPWLLAFDALLLAGLLLVLFPLASGAVTTAIKESKAKYAIVAWLEEVAQNALTFRTAAGAAYAVNRTDHLASTYLKYRGEHFRVLMRQLIGSFTMQALASATLLGVGGWLVIQRQLTLGQLIAAELIVAMVVSSFTKFNKHLETFYDLLAAIDKLGYLTDLPLERSSGEGLPALQQGAAIRMNNVSFRFDGGDEIVRDIDLDLPPGSRSGLRGLSGHGKSTVVDILFGLRQPTRGIVMIDDHDYRDLSLVSLRAQVALVRNAEIFHGTVADNIRLGNPNIGLKDMWQALSDAGLLDIVQALPEGLNTELATGGLPLSPGQAVRLTLARAFALRPRFLIIDEALDAIDDVRERECLLQAVFSPSAPWTLLVVSADEAILRRCDRVFTLRDGTLSGVPQMVSPRGI